MGPLLLTPNGSFTVSDGQSSPSSSFQVAIGLLGMSQLSGKAVWNQGYKFLFMMRGQNQVLKLASISSLINFKFFKKPSRCQNNFKDNQQE